MYKTFSVVQDWSEERVILKPCWVDQTRKPHKNSGYPLITVRRKTYRGHRESYKLFRGPIPKGKVLDHLCRNKACYNPWHLEAVDQRQNVLRGKVPIVNGESNRLKTHCSKGHPLSGHNVYQRGSRRHCKVCKLESQRRIRNRSQ